jgi:aminomethyltransferase
VADLHQLPIGQGTLSLFTNEQGGIIDDTIIMQQQDSLYVVSNAACADKDLAHIRKHLAEFQNKGFDVDFNIIQDHSLIALQGPKAAEALEGLVGKSLEDFSFMHGRQMDIAGIPCHVARSGYTGEDGFEVSDDIWIHPKLTHFFFLQLSIPTEEINTLTEKLLAHPDVELAGLGARDSLRLEAGLCLYGHDLDETTTPVEAGLTWTIRNYPPFYKTQRTHMLSFSEISQRDRWLLGCRAHLATDQGRCQPSTCRSCRPRCTCA